MESIHGLSVGVEVDYNVVDGFWILARVESCSVDGSILLLRFSCGLREVSHCLSLRRPQDARRIAPAGETSLLCALKSWRHVVADVYFRLAFMNLQVCVPFRC